jgi:ParB family chromosome partitioning protein
LLGREEGGFEAGSLDASQLIQVPVDQIDPNPFQPRRYFSPEDITALADSLRQHGVLQPILVREAGPRYQLIAGERRLRASIEAQLHDIPARVLDLDDQRVFELAMVENLQREDLNAIDKATAFRQYLERYGGTQEELASRLGLDRSTVSNLIRLLELPEAIIEAVRKSVISQGHARALLGMPDDDNRLAALPRIVGEHLSVRQTEALVAAGQPRSARSRIRRDSAHLPGEKPPHVAHIERELGGRLGATVSIRAKNDERGQIVIDYHSRQEFDRLTAIIQGGPATTRLVTQGRERTGDD